MAFRVFTSALLSVFAVSALAIEPPLICTTSQCSQSQKYLEQKFFENNGLLPEPVGQMVYSGACYVQGKGYDPDHKHWGVVFFDLKNDQVYFGGKFGFFNKTNPFENLTAIDAKKDFGSRMYKDDHRTQLNDGYAFVDLNPNSKDIWYYWFTQDSETQTIYLKAYWTIHYFLMCELQPNQQE